HPTWLWRAETGAVIEALGFAGSPFSPAGRESAGRDWLARLGPVHEDRVGPGLAGPEPGGPGPDSPMLGWAGIRPFSPAEAERLRQAARFAVAPLAALTGRAALAALLEAYLGRRSAARVQAGALRRGAGETIRAALLCADLRDFTAIGPAVNLVSRLEGLCRPLGRSVLISGAVAAETAAPLVPLGDYALRGIAAPCAVFTLPDV